MNDNNMSKVPKFLKRLFRETNDEGNGDIVWTEDGTRIRIVNKDAFIKSTLPSLSKTKEYSAFIRQLNIYGFVKVKVERSEDIEEYYNCFFKRGQPNLLGFMKRVSKSSKAANQLNLPTVENTLSFLTTSNYRLSNEVATLKERVDKQEMTINGLVEILGRVFRSGIQNAKFDSAIGQQSTEKLLRYSLDTPPSGRGSLDDIVGGGEARADSPKKRGDKKYSDEASLPDMDDIFF
ncbi:hypothetical protein PAPHI01_0622 [Pancytospora philotis]|nr:hypothetical protein PAPHI01_0622 [Pancytospora philotis]